MTHLAVCKVTGIEFLSHFNYIGQIHPLVGVELSTLAEGFFQGIEINSFNTTISSLPMYPRLLLVKYLIDNDLLDHQVEVTKLTIKEQKAIANNPDSIMDYVLTLKTVLEAKTRIKVKYRSISNKTLYSIVEIMGKEKVYANLNLKNIKGIDAEIILHPFANLGAADHELSLLWKTISYCGEDILFLSDKWIGVLISLSSTNNELSYIYNAMLDNIIQAESLFAENKEKKVSLTPKINFKGRSLWN